VVVVVVVVVDVMLVVVVVVVVVEVVVVVVVDVVVVHTPHIFGHLVRTCLTTAGLFVAVLHMEKSHVLPHCGSSTQ
jgi:hypothetical protein